MFLIVFVFIVFLSLIVVVEELMVEFRLEIVFSFYPYKSVAFSNNSNINRSPNYFTTKSHLISK